MTYLRVRSVRAPGVTAVTLLLAVLVLGLLLAGCGGPTPTPQILVVTATSTPEALVQVVTATFTPQPVQIVTATFTPAPEGETGATPVLQPTNTLAPTAQQPVQPANTDTPLPPPTAESVTLPPPNYFTFEHSSGAFSVDIPDTSDYADHEDGLVFAYGDSLFMVTFTVVDEALTPDEMEQAVSAVIDDALVSEGLISSYDDLNIQQNATGDAVASAFTVVFDSGTEGEGQLVILQTGRTVYTLILLTPDYASIADVWETLTETLRVAPMETAAATATPAPPTAKPVSLKSYFVVYTSFQGPDVQDYSLWGMNGDGSGAFKVEGAGQASEPAFSPDGNKFAFYHWIDGVYIWNLNKKTSTRIVDNSEASFPTWAPKGARLAYCNLYGQPWIHIVNSDGSGDHQLTPGLRPNWALSGGFIAYDSCENNKCGIFRINPDGGGKRQITSDGGGGAAVSPNGKKIAYWSRADGDFEIYVVNADGSGKKQLTKNRGNDALPAWSPDGKYIYYLSDQNGKGWAVMVMNTNGSNQRKVVKTNAGNDPRRGWQYQRITVTWND